MAQDRFGIYPFQATYGEDTLALNQISRVGIRPDARREICIPGGAIDPSAVVLNYADPAIELSTDDIATALTVVSPTAGLACDGGCVAQFQHRADGATFTGSSTHALVTSLKGFLFPKILTVDQDQQGGARLDLEYRAQYDGSTSGSPALPVPPLVMTASGSLTGTPTFTGRYYLGPIYLSAAQIPSIVGFSIDFGITYETMRADGDLWPQVGSIVKRQPKLRFKIRKVDYAATTGFFNTALGSALKFYLRLFLAGGARVSDATAAHIKLTVATGAWAPDDLEVVAEQDATVTVEVALTGTIAAALASAIP